MTTLITSIPTFDRAAARVSAPFDHQAFAWSAEYAAEATRHLLIVGGSRSWCANCGLPADPYEGHHLNVLGSAQAQAGCFTDWRWAATTCDTALARRFVAEDLELIDAGIASFDELGNFRDSLRLSPATHVLL